MEPFVIFIYFVFYLFVYSLFVCFYNLLFYFVYFIFYCAAFHLYGAENVPLQCVNEEEEDQEVVLGQHTNVHERLELEADLSELPPHRQCRYSISDIPISTIDLLTLI